MDLFAAILSSWTCCTVTVAEPGTRLTDPELDPRDAGFAVLTYGAIAAPASSRSLPANMYVRATPYRPHPAHISMFMQLIYVNRESVYPERSRSLNRDLSYPSDVPNLDSAV